MSIQTELTRITNAKAAIKTAIEGKGVTVPDGTMLDGMAALIEAISAGGTKSFFVTEFTPDSNVESVTITHDLGDFPNFSAVFRKKTINDLSLVADEVFMSVLAPVYKKKNNIYCNGITVYKGRSGLSVNYGSSSGSLVNVSTPYVSYTNLPGSLKEAYKEKAVISACINNYIPLYAAGVPYTVILGIINLE